MVSEIVERIRLNLWKVRERLASAAHAVGRDPGDVRLIVVTKAQPLEILEAVIEAGATDLGENYAEEAAKKIETLRVPQGVQWHMIGHVQSRKARLVCQYFHMIQSLDSIKLAKKLNDCAKETNHLLPVLLEVNLGGEETKTGFPVWDAAYHTQFQREIETLLSLDHLQIRGLMAMPPLGETPEDSRPYFKQLRSLQLELKQRFPQIDWHELSMGTSYDFEVAVQEGATFVRIGQAIVGPRPPHG